MIHRPQGHDGCDKLRSKHRRDQCAPSRRRALKVRQAAKCAAARSSCLDCEGVARRQPQQQPGDADALRVSAACGWREIELPR